MQVGIATSEDNPNHSWLSARGGWVSYTLGVVLLHVVLRSIPLLHGPPVWTLTNVVHNVLMYIILHTLKGAPWLTSDQGESRRLTHWEQIDYGTQFTETRKFLTVFPIVLFLITSYCTNYEFSHFLVNIATLVLVLLPKLPLFHKVRLFNINKY